MLISIRRGLLLSIVVATAAFAQSYPAKPVRMVAPYPPGGSNDIVARLVGQKLAEALGQQFIIENRAGASGNIGTEHVAKAAADGYTLLMSGSNTFATNPHIFARLPFDPARDFAPVILIANQSNVLVVHPSLPAANVKALIALTRAHPGKVTFGSGGVGASQHMSAALFMMMTGADMLHVPYKGGAPAMYDLTGGQIDLMFETTPSAFPYISAGKVRALGVTSLQRSPMLPAIPTMSEAGLAGFEFQQWLGLVAPAGTPKDIIARLNAEINNALRGDLRKRLEDLGLEVAGGTSEDHHARIRTESVQFAKIVKVAKITPQ